MNLNECYQRLELPPTATSVEVRQAYKRLVKNWHPDRFEADASMKAYAEERLKIINAAYDRLRKHLTAADTQQMLKKKAGGDKPSQRIFFLNEVFPNIAHFKGKNIFIIAMCDDELEKYICVTPSKT